PNRTQTVPIRVKDRLSAPHQQVAAGGETRAHLGENSFFRLFRKVDDDVSAQDQMLIRRISIFQQVVLREVHVSPNVRLYLPATVRQGGEKPTPPFRRHFAQPLLVEHGLLRLDQRLSVDVGSEYAVQPGTTGLHLLQQY